MARYLANVSTLKDAEGPLTGPFDDSDSAVFLGIEVFSAS